MKIKKVKTSIRQTFANNLKKVRLSKNISQEKLAELAGLHRTYVSSVERGERNISIDNIGRLAFALNVPASSLIGGKDK